MQTDLSGRSHDVQRRKGTPADCATSPLRTSTQRSPVGLPFTSFVQRHLQKPPCLHPSAAHGMMAGAQQRLPPAGRSGSLRANSLPLERPEDAFTEVDEACDKLSQVLSDLCAVKADLLIGSGADEARQLKLAAATALEDVARMLRTQGPAAAIAEVRRGYKARQGAWFRVWQAARTAASCRGWCLHFVPPRLLQAPPCYPARATTPGPAHLHAAISTHHCALLPAGSPAGDSGRRHQRPGGHRAGCAPERQPCRQPPLAGRGAEHRWSSARACRHCRQPRPSPRPGEADLCWQHCGRESPAAHASSGRGAGTDAGRARQPALAHGARGQCGAHAVSAGGACFKRHSACFSVPHQSVRWRRCPFTSCCCHKCHDATSAAQHVLYTGFLCYDGAGCLPISDLHGPRDCTNESKVTFGPGKGSWKTGTFRKTAGRAALGSKNEGRNKDGSSHNRHWHSAQQQTCGADELGAYIHACMRTRGRT